MKFEPLMWGRTASTRWSFSSTARRNEVTSYLVLWRGHKSADDEWLRAEELVYCLEKVANYDAAAPRCRALPLARDAGPCQRPGPDWPYCLRLGWFLRSVIRRRWPPVKSGKILGALRLARSGRVIRVRVQGHWS